MQWTMPRRVLQVVAGLIGLAAVGSFSMGVINAPSHGRLPGEKAPGEAPSAMIQATEATPLSQERIEGPPPPPELTPEEKAKQDADKKARDAAAAAARLAADSPEANGAAPGAPTLITPPAAGDRVGDLLDSVTPPPSEDPPH
ncbi:MAG: hypothetical protein JWQ52_668 [Phenylobacterium sp.]|jgi:hypothetical protein|nr:hypothetical protein [Phenylobacterium sp.]